MRTKKKTSAFNSFSKLIPAGTTDFLSPALAQGRTLTKANASIDKGINMLVILGIKTETGETMRLKNGSVSNHSNFKESLISTERVLIPENADWQLISSLANLTDQDVTLTLEMVTESI